MELHRIRGGTKEALESKEYTIGVGISLGNKWFTTENIIALIRWSLSYTRREVVVYVADAIHAINIEVRNGRSKGSSSRLARQKGKKVLDEIKKEAEKVLSTKEREKIVYATWDDLATENYKEHVNYLYDLYSANPEFKSHITSIVQNWISGEGKHFNEKEIDHLGTYILEELPEMIARVPIKGVVYDANVYPFDGEISKLAEDIQLGTLFPKIKEVLLDTEPKVFLEVR